MEKAGSKTPQPLSNLHFLIPRPVTGSVCRLGEMVRRLGGTYSNSPVIRLESALSPAEIRKMLESTDLNRDVLIFVSPSCARIFFDQMTPDDFENVQKMKIGAIGDGTARSLEALGLSVEFRARVPNSDALADELVTYDRSAAYRLCRADRGSPVLAERLTDAGIRFEEWVIYRSVDITEPDPTTMQDLKNRRFDWVLVTSSMIARNLVQLYGSQLGNTRIASMSPAISETLRELKMSPTVESPISHFQSLLEAVVG